MRQTLQRATKEVRHLGVIGDVHARIDLLQRAADALEAAGVDILVCVGDIYAQREGSAECCRFLRDRRIQTVRGNHDRWFLDAAVRDTGLWTSIGTDAIEFLSALPITLTVDSVAGPILICHGVGSNDLAHIPRTFPHSFVRRAIRIELIPAECKLVIHGHSHLQKQQHLAGIMFVTVGPLHSHPSGGCILVDSQNGTVTTVAY